jgi:hypothetical protein
MKIYKFRSFDRIEYLFDILENKEVYCSKYQYLNDPFEGQFIKIYRSQYGSNQYGTTSYSNTKKRSDLSDKYNLQDLRICSFSLAYNDVRMWSYYANSHTGVCIEFEIDDNIEETDFYIVNYERDLKVVTTDVLNEKIAINILRRKTCHWEFEKEIRLITKKEKYHLIPTSIIIGHRASHNHIGIINKIANTIPIKMAFLQDDLTVEC